MFDRWVSSWETVRIKKVRNARFELPNGTSITVTVIMDAHTDSAELRRVEKHFESGASVSDFTLRRDCVDPDPWGATLMETVVDDLVVDLDVFQPGVEPGPAAYFGMGDDQHGPRD